MEKIKVTHLGEDYSTIEVKGEEYQGSLGLGEALLKVLKEKQPVFVGKVKVENMQSPRGGAVANQFIISMYDAEGNLHEFFQSYSSIIVHRDMKGHVHLDKRYWDYSTTTGKYRNQFLGEDINDTRKKIESGEYLLLDLN